MWYLILRRDAAPRIRNSIRAGGRPAFRCAPERSNSGRKPRPPGLGGPTVRKPSHFIKILAALLLLCSNTSMGGTRENVPWLPGAALLVGYPPANLSVITPDRRSKLQDEGGDWYIDPSISANGRVVASAHRVSTDPPASRPRLVIATYSMPDKKWTDYEGVETMGGAVAISPAGNKLACLMREGPDGHSNLHILDLKTGKAIQGPLLPEFAGTKMSWSPDGRRLAFDIEVNARAQTGVATARQAIYVLDVDSGGLTKIADGRSPSWSPSGEWIAFLDYSPAQIARRLVLDVGNSVGLVRPDGGDAKLLVTFDGDETPKLAPVWSPDSKTILINRFRDDLKATMDIYLLELDTLKLTRKFENTPPVFGWVDAK